MKQAWKFECQPHFGIPCSSLLDSRHNWMITGSSRGVFSLWDLRFKLQVKNWAHPSRGRISKIVPVNYPLSMEKDIVLKSGYGILAAVDGRFSEISAWDLYTGECKEVWCAITSNNKQALSTTTLDPEIELAKVYQDGLKVRIILYGKWNNDQLNNAHFFYVKKGGPPPRIH